MNPTRSILVKSWCKCRGGARFDLIDTATTFVGYWNGSGPESCLVRRRCGRLVQYHGRQFVCRRVAFNYRQLLDDGSTLVGCLAACACKCHGFGTGIRGCGLLPAARVILAERDDILTNGIQAACRLAAAKHEKDGKRRGRVVAVLGLLHVNGVAKRMLSTVKDDSSKTQK